MGRVRRRRDGGTFPGAAGNRLDALGQVIHNVFETAPGLGLEPVNSGTASEIRRKQLYDSNTFFHELSSVGTALGTCFGAVLRATLGDLVGPWGRGAGGVPSSGNGSDEPCWSGRSEEINAPECAEIRCLGERHARQVGQLHGPTEDSYVFRQAVPACTRGGRTADRTRRSSFCLSVC